MEVDVAPVMLIQDAATQSGMTATSTADQHSATWSNKPLEPAEISHLLLLLVIMHKMLRLLTEPGSMSTMAGGSASMRTYRMSSLSRKPASHLYYSIASA